jgi:hypothetical protein
MTDARTPVPSAQRPGNPQGAGSSAELLEDGSVPSPAGLRKTPGWSPQSHPGYQELSPGAQKPDLGMAGSCPVRDPSSEEAGDGGDHGGMSWLTCGGPRMCQAAGRVFQEHQKPATYGALCRALGSLGLSGDQQELGDCPFVWAQLTWVMLYGTTSCLGNRVADTHSPA